MITDERLRLFSHPVRLFIKYGGELRGVRLVVSNYPWEGVDLEE